MKLKIRKIRMESVFVLTLIFTLVSTLIYAVSTTLQSPAGGFVDDDGFLDLRASCEPTSENDYDGTTSWNITNATLYSNVQGVWKANKTLQVENPIANSTYYFNFTNSINKTAEGEFIWDVQCYEANSTNNGANIDEAFAGPRIIKVEYARAIVTTVSPADESFDSDGQEVLIECSAIPSSGWNITQIDLMTNVSLDWKPDQTFIISTRSVDTQFDNGFIFSLSSGVDVTEIIFSCSATQVKNDLEGAPTSEKSSANRTLNIGTPTCTADVCDRDNQRWCDVDKWSVIDYCNKCGNEDSTNCLTCAANACDLVEQKWCEKGIWESGTYSQYCSQCSQKDNTCPICEAGACDTDNQNWCDNGVWTKKDYCNIDKCGKIDESCGQECAEETCDTTNRKLCKDGKWEEANYCLVCGDVDSSCSIKCTDKACDTKNQQWCNNGKWTNVNYCNNCGAKDVSCGLACESSLNKRVCDTTANRWCNIVFWAKLNYCEKCQDSQCSGVCTNNACDINAQKWCNNGIWSDDVNYCDKCGSKDSSCGVTCQEDICDITSNERCFNGEWTIKNYCDNCGLKDSDCTLFCAEGECDTTNKKVCTSGVWTEKSYDTLCVVQAVAPSKESCNEDGNCTIDSYCTDDSECVSEFCYENKCTEPTCDDGERNGNETDVDCGGDKCDRCNIGETCKINLDCSSNLCESRTCKRINTCKDGIKNFGETDVDCGGSCRDKCKLQKACKVDDDCESGLVCDSQICSERKPGSGLIPIDERERRIAEIPYEERDSDNDGIPDIWEEQNGLDPNDPSDSNYDYDQDGLINIQEFTYGTDPNKADTDGDGVSDKEEIDKGTDPLELKDKPGVGLGILIVIIALLVIFGLGGYGVFYYVSRHVSQRGIELQEQKPAFMPSYTPQKQALRKPFGKTRVEEIVEKRRTEKEGKREKLLEAFGKKSPKPKEGKSLVSMAKEKQEIEKIMPGKTKEDVFSELKLISKKEKEEKK